MQYLSSFYKSPYYVYANPAKYAKMIYCGATISDNLFPNFKLVMDENSQATLFNGLEEAYFETTVAPTQDSSFDFFWAYSKILANMSVGGQFCNLDSDLFIWNKDVIRDDCDFFFYSLDIPRGNPAFVNPFYEVGYRILKNADALPAILEGSFENKVFNFPIYNFGITKCNNFAAYEYYFDILSEVMKKSEKITELAKSNRHPLAHLGSSTTSYTCVTSLLEQILMSKVIHDKKLDVLTIYPSYSDGQYFPKSKEDIKNTPVTHLMHRKQTPKGLSEIEELYSNVVKGNFTLFKDSY